MALPNWAATTAPSAATASSPATRAMALLTPDAMPALCSSASASTVAVSGATVAESPSEKSSRAGSRSVDVVDVGVDALQQREPRRRDQRADAHEPARPEAVGHAPRAARQREHHERDRQRRQAGLQRVVAGDLLQEEHEEEDHRAQPAVHRERLEVADREVAPPEQPQRQHRVGRAAPRG